MADENVVANEYAIMHPARYQHARATTQLACFLVFLVACGGAAVGLGVQTDLMGKALVLFPSLFAIAGSGAALTSL